MIVFVIRSRCSWSAPFSASYSGQSVRSTNELEHAGHHGRPPLARVPVGPDPVAAEEGDEKALREAARRRELVLDGRVRRLELEQARLDSPPRGVGRVALAVRRASDVERLDPAELVEEAFAIVHGRGG
jgi:hypothetical protein